MYELVVGIHARQVSVKHCAGVCRQNKKGKKAKKKKKKKRKRAIGEGVDDCRNNDVVPRIDCPWENMNKAPFADQLAN
jgi:hypothetical protein